MTEEVQINIVPFDDFMDVGQRTSSSLKALVEVGEIAYKAYKASVLSAAWVSQATPHFPYGVGLMFEGFLNRPIIVEVPVSCELTGVLVDVRYWRGNYASLKLMPDAGECVLPGTLGTTGTKPSLLDFSDPVADVKDWGHANRDERGEVNIDALKVFITAQLKQLKQDPERVIEKALDQGVLSPSPNPGKLVVV